MYKSPHESAPPSLPPRPAGKGRPVPAAPVEEIYDDCDDENGIPPMPEDEYDDFEAGSPPPLPPHPEVYDDIEQQSPQRPPLPQRSKPPIPLMTAPASAPQEEYDDCGPIVQQLRKKPQPAPPAPTPTPSSHAGRLPPPPQESVYEMGDDDENGDESGQSQPPLPPPPPINDDEMRAIYEVEPDVDAEIPTRSPTPPPPSPPRKTPGLPLPPTPDHAPPQPPRHQPHQAASNTATSPKGAAPAGGFAMNLGMLQNAKAGLRRVSHDSGTPEPSPSNDPKVYGGCPDTVYDAKKVFEHKSGGGKPGPFKQSSFEKAHPTTPSAATTHKPQQAVKPVTKTEPVPQPEVPEDIYDEASSFVPDPLMRYDWYHGNISRPQGDQRVRTVAKDGAFLVRVSEKDPKFPFTLVVFHMGSVNNLRIRSRSDGKVALGDEKTGELAFKDVPAMIDHHRSHNVVLLGNNQSQVKLQHTAPRS